MISGTHRHSGWPWARDSWGQIIKQRHGEQQQESSGNNPAPNVLPRMKVCPVGCTAGRDEAETKYQRARQDKDILNGERRESWRNSPMTLGAAQIWFSAPWEEDPDDSTPHAGSDIDWVLPPSSFNPMTWTWEGLAQELDARNFPGSLVVKTLRCQCRGGRFNAWVGNYDPTRCAY